MARTIVITHTCTDLFDHATVQKWVAACQRQIVGDLAPHWGQSAVLHYVGDSQIEKAGPEDDLCNIVRTASSPGSLGSHWLDGKRAIMDVGLQTCIDDGVPPSSCLDHELAEATVDRYGTLCFQVGQLMLAAESNDRVEGSDPSYQIDGISMENFSLPAAFLEGVAGPYDFRGKCDSNIVLPNGYQLQVDLGTNQWQQATGALARASKRVAAENSRRASRMRRAGVAPSTLVLVAA